MIYIKHDKSAIVSLFLFLCDRKEWRWRWERVGEWGLSESERTSLMWAYYFLGKVIGFIIKYCTFALIKWVIPFALSIFLKGIRTLLWQIGESLQAGKRSIIVLKNSTTARSLDLCRKQKRLKTQEVGLRRISFFVLRYNRRIVTLCVGTLYSYRWKKSSAYYDRKKQPTSHVYI